MNLRPLSSNRRYNLALFSQLRFSYIVHYQYFKSKNTVTPIPLDFPSFPCWAQMKRIPLQSLRVSINSDFDSTCSIRRDDACCFIE